MSRLAAFALLVGGIVLMMAGSSASGSLGSGFSRLFTGNPSDRAMWLLIGGGLVAIVGVAGLFRSTK